MDSLINLDSPLNRNKLKTNYESNSPLIPGPSNILTHETPNNPFDEAIRTVELNQRPDDPFDIVLEEALKSKKNINDKSEIRSADENEKDSTTESCADDEVLKNKIREFVSERIFKCIKKTLNSSMSQTNLSENKKSSDKYFQRSYSASHLRPVVLGSFEDSSCSNCSNKLNSSLPLESNCTSNSLPRKVLNTTGNFLSENTYVLKETSINDFEVTKRALRSEAEKMRRLISLELLPNSSNKNDSEVSNTNVTPEDLLDMTPPWENCDFDLTDEEDSIGLPKLKKFNLNARCSVGNETAIDEKALNKYLKRRSSTDVGQPDDPPKADDSIQTVDFFSPKQIAASSSLLEDEFDEHIDKIEVVPPKLKDVIEDRKLETHPIKDETNTDGLRLKKTSVKDKVLKKGPMKAVLPLQKMSKNLSAKITSPFKNKTSVTNKNNAKEQKQNDNIHPVATSTPTKSPVSDESIASLRSRENNRMSPTGRKAARRSQSTSKVEISKTSSEEPISMSTAASGSGETTSVNKVVKDENNKTVTRPHSAPEASAKATSHRSALKVLVSSPVQKSMRSSVLKNALRPKQSLKSTVKDKENQSKLKKK